MRPITSPQGQHNLSMCTLNLKTKSVWVAVRRMQSVTAGQKEVGVVEKNKTFVIVPRVGH